MIENSTNGMKKYLKYISEQKGKTEIKKQVSAYF